MKNREAWINQNSALSPPFEGGLGGSKSFTSLAN